MGKKVLLALILVSAVGLVTLLSRGELDQYHIDMINKELFLFPSSAGVLKPFNQYDATLFQDAHPWLGEKITIVYENMLLGNSDNYGKPPDENQVKQRLSAYIGRKRLILDVQSWSILTNNNIDPMAEQHKQWYLQILKWAKEVLPGCDLGFYGLPFNASDAIIEPEASVNYDRALNIMQPVLDASDSVYPSYDVVYDNPHILEAMLLKALYPKKPNYPVMWHRGSGSSFMGKILPAGLIEKQCKLVRQYADGLVWWSSWIENWDDGIWYTSAAECFKNFGKSNSTEAIQKR